jgi:hypothetical protein
MFLLVHIMSSVAAIINKGAKFGWSVVTNLGLLPSWIKNEDEFANYFIIFFFFICFFGSLPSKIAALRYFTFITAIINLFLSGLLIYQTTDLRSFYQERGAQFADYKINKQIFGSYCLSLFSSVNQFSVVNVLSEYKNPTERRVNKVAYSHPAHLPITLYPSRCVPISGCGRLLHLWKSM